MSPDSFTDRHWIDGDWVDFGRRRTSIDLATGAAIGNYADGGAAEAARAIAAARWAFSDTDWCHDRRLRARALHQMANRFEARMADLGDILALENGKIRPEARFEVAMVPPKLRYAAALSLADHGHAIEVTPGGTRLCRARRWGSPASSRSGIRRSCSSSGPSHRRSPPAAPPSPSFQAGPPRSTRGCARFSPRLGPCQQGSSTCSRSRGAMGAVPMSTRRMFPQSASRVGPRPAGPSRRPGPSTRSGAEAGWKISLYTFNTQSRQGKQ